MRAFKDKSLEYLDLLLTPHDQDFTGAAAEAKLNAFLLCGTAFVVGFVLWATYCHVSLYVFKRPTRWHKPEALLRAGLKVAPRGSVMAQLGLNMLRLCEGVALIGQTGSGKSSLLKRLLVEVLYTGCGCLWLAVKADEPMTACKVLYKAGRVAELFIPGKSKCNLLVYELARKGGGPATMAEFLMRADEVMNGGHGGKEESFWKSARLQTATLAIAAIAIASRHPTFEQVYDFLLSAPSSMEQLSSEAFRRGNCHLVLQQAAANAKSPQDQRIVAEAINYFTNLLPSASEKVYGATVMHLNAMLAPFVRGEMFETINCAQSDILPDDPLKGKCIVMANPVVDNPGNQLFQILFSMMTVEATLRRPVTAEMPVVTLVRDEYQLVGNSKFDAQAQTIARQQRLACITAFQSLSVLHESCAEPMRAKHQSAALLGNLNTKLLLSNTDLQTMEFFSELSGKHWKAVSGGGQLPQQQTDALGVNGDFNVNFHSQLLPRKLGTALTNLRTGGPDNDFIVEAYVHAPGRRFNGQTFAKIAIEQDIEL
jgi:hypothetical protein